MDVSVIDIVNIFGFEPPQWVSNDPRASLILLRLFSSASKQHELLVSTRKSSFFNLNGPLPASLSTQGFIYFSGLDGAAGGEVNRGEMNNIEEYVTVRCVVCRICVDMNLKTPSQMLHHDSNCQFHRALQYYSSISRPSQAHDVDNLYEHLIEQMKSVKTQVAREIGYDNDTICTAMGLYFLCKKKPFLNAGALVEYLMDNFDKFTCEGKMVMSVVRGISNIFPSGRPHHQTITKPSSIIIASTNVALPPQRQLSISQLRAQTMILYADTLCKLCFKEKKTLLLKPCFHLALCAVCIKQKDVKCPVCWIVVENHTVVYF